MLTRSLSNNWTCSVWLVWKGCRRTPLLSKKNMAAQLRFAKLHLNKPQDFWNNVLWTDDTEVEMFGHNPQQHVWRKPNTVHQHKHPMPTVKCGGGGVNNWACFAATGPGHLALSETCQAICLTVKAWLKLGHATRQWPQTEQQIYKRMDIKEKNQAVAMLQSKFRPRPDSDAVVGS